MPWWGTLAITLGGWLILFLINLWAVKSQHKKSGADLVAQTRESLKVLETKFDLGVVTWPKFDKSVQRVHDRVTEVEKDTAIDLDELNCTTQEIKVQVTEIVGKVDAFAQVCGIHQEQTKRLEEKQETDIRRMENKHDADVSRLGDQIYKDRRG